MQQEHLIIHDHKFVKTITDQRIQARIKELADEINEDFKDREFVVVGVLTGAFIFVADLLRALSHQIPVDFVKISSYRGMQPGKITKSVSLSPELNGKHVLVVEDIIDSGNTLAYFKNILDNSQVKSVSTATLLLKPDVFQDRFPIDYVGFEIPDKFVIGYGMDYNDFGRGLKDIYQLVDV